jgi:predicted ATPase/DNA-binding CsgD family transcriptional regulator
MAMEKRPSFGELLRQYRLAAGLTQGALAERAGLSVRGLSDLERGARRVPHPATVRRLVQVLNLSDVEREAVLAVRDRSAAENASGARRTRSSAALLAPLTSFVGREHELDDVQRLLGDTRLLTLTGTGGIGKTRLALHVASVVGPSFADGAVGVDLASLESPTLVPQAVAATLGVPENPGRPLLSMLADDLQKKQVLVVLDNCEHLLNACAELADYLLRVCPDLKILATSREPLGIAGEVAWRVPSLAAPDLTGDLSIECLAQSDAVRLFLERATAVMPGFTLTDQNARAVSEVCQHLDGVPLAIELAAARVRVLAPAQIAERLDDRFGLLTGGSRTAPPRHQTLRAALAWSYDLLSAAERLLFDRLSVFAGGWSLEAAEGVASCERGTDPLAARTSLLDTLASLVDKSLVLAEAGADGPIRYRLLETLRQYGQERLTERGDAEASRRRHADFFLSLAEHAGQELHGPEQRVWLARLAQEQDNFRAALGWSIERGEQEISLRLSGALAGFWRSRAYVNEGWEWLLRALKPGGGSTAVRAQALNAAASLAHYRADHATASASYAESLALWRQLGDEHGIANALEGLGITEVNRGEPDLAESPLLESLARFRALGDRLGIAGCLSNLGNLAHARRELKHAGALFQESLVLAREQGDTWHTAYVLHAQGHLAWNQGDDARAAALLKESLVLSGELEDRRGIAAGLESLALVAGGQHQADRAARLFGAAASLRAVVGVGQRAWLRDDFDLGVAATRAALGEAAFAAEHATGRAMLLDEAVAYALTDDHEPATAEPDRLASQSARGTDPLTPREHEVAVLVSRGLTNRQIAAELVIAEGTAANHVKHILTRHGFDSRVQIAAWVAGHDLHRPALS